MQPIKFRPNRLINYPLVFKQSALLAKRHLLGNFMNNYQKIFRGVNMVNIKTRDKKRLISPCVNHTHFQKLVHLLKTTGNLMLPQQVSRKPTMEKLEDHCDYCNIMQPFTTENHKIILENVRKNRQTAMQHAKIPVTIVCPRNHLLSNILSFLFSFF